jgi:hypothetical protein
VKRCSKCQSDKAFADFYRRASTKSGYMSECKLCHNAWQESNYPKKRIIAARHRAKLRAEALASLGGACVRCGIDDLRVLHIDHIHGGGRVEKRKIGDSAIHRKILAGDTAPYQILCANCHNIKTWHADTDALFAGGASKPNQLRSEA